MGKELLNITRNRKVSIKYYKPVSIGAFEKFIEENLIKLHLKYKNDLTFCIEEREEYEDNLYHLFVKVKGIKGKICIYLNSFYQNYLKTGDINRILEILWETIEAQIILLNSKSQNPNFESELSAEELEDAKIDYEYSKLICSELKNKNYLKQNVELKLINYEKNLEYLKNVPHLKYGEFAITFNIFKILNNEDIINISILNSDIVPHGLSAEELFKYAKNNMKRNERPFLFQGDCLIQDEFNLRTDKTISNIFKNRNIHFYTNNIGSYGASVIFDDNIMELMTDKFNSGFYLYAINVHQWIIFPQKETNDIETVSEILEILNFKSTEKERNSKKFLSEEIYYFDKDKKKLMLNGKEMVIEEVCEAGSSLALDNE